MIYFDEIPFDDIFTVLSYIRTRPDDYNFEYLPDLKEVELDELLQYLLERGFIKRHEDLSYRATFYASRSEWWYFIGFGLNSVPDIAFDWYDDEPDAAICLGSLAAYNEGRLVYRWISLPTDETALDECMAWVTQNGQHDFHIQDTYGNWPISEFDDPVNLNLIFQDMEDLDDYSKVAVRFLVSQGYKLDDAVLRCQDETRVYEDWDDAIDDYIELFRIDDDLLRYLNRDLIRSDLEDRGYTKFEGWIIEHFQ